MEWGVRAGGVKFRSVELHHSAEGVGGGHDNIVLLVLCAAEESKGILHEYKNTAKLFQ